MSQDKAKQSKNVGNTPEDPKVAYYMGWLASVRGVGKHRNPHVVDSEAYEWWKRGWETKYYKEDYDKNAPE